MFVDWYAPRLTALPPAAHVPAYSPYRQSDFIRFLRRQREFLDRQHGLSKYVCVKLQRPAKLRWCPMWGWCTHYVQGTIPGAPGHLRSCLEVIVRLTCV